MTFHASVHLKTQTACVEALCQEYIRSFYRLYASSFNWLIIFRTAIDFPVSIGVNKYLKISTVLSSVKHQLKFSFLDGYDVSISAKMWITNKSLLSVSLKGWCVSGFLAYMKERR